ncbi:MAG: signal recognition particle-docking protein FtsY [Nanoarchaeota archaeon]|nr:signal recognition particle-docking protein FtsY [Nanoarchaeota archaeon]
MFDLFKKKIKDAISKVSSKVEEKTKEDIIEEKKELIEKDIIKEVKPKKESIFQRIMKKATTKKISKEKFEDLFWDIELALLENNVAVEVIEKIKLDLTNKIVDKEFKKKEFKDIINNGLKESLNEILRFSSLDLLEEANKIKPLIICFVGINGAGKTTTIAKIAKLFQDNKKSVSIAAADTFRAAAIEQLEEHANNLGIKLIKHEYGSDAAAVAFDAIEHAKSKNKDVVLIDTAGRLHSNKNLIAELKKIIKVASPHLTLFIGESITGNDCIEQAKQFNKSIGIDGIILAKADIDEKGGAAISISFITKKPILYLGTGQRYQDLIKFNKEKILLNLGL